MYSITYINTFKLYNDWSEPKEEYGRLMVDGNKSFYQSYNSMSRDSLKANNKFDRSQRGFFSFNTYAISIENEDVLYEDVIFEDEYFYKEKIDLAWKIGKNNKIINGYKCKNASVNYGGRLWEAWYAVDIPINAGPYKFKGLPGLIVKLTDSTNSYSFEIYSIVVKELKTLSKFYHLKPLEQRIEMSHKEFNKFRYEFEKLSLNDRINYGKSGPRLELIVTGLDDADDMRANVKNTSTARSNFIEIDHKK